MSNAATGNESPQTKPPPEVYVVSVSVTDGKVDKVVSVHTPSDPSIAQTIMSEEVGVPSKLWDTVGLKMINTEDGTWLSPQIIKDVASFSKEKIAAELKASTRKTDGGTRRTKRKGGNKRRTKSKRSKSRRRR